MTTTTNVAGLDGGGKAITLRAEQATDLSLAMHSVPEVAGLPISSANPMPGATAPLAYLSQSALLVTALVLPGQSTVIIDAGVVTRTLTIFTAPGSTGNVWLNPGSGPAVVGQGAPVMAGGGSFTFDVPPSGAVSAISDNGDVAISAIGG